VLTTKGRYQTSQLNRAQVLRWNARNARNPRRFNFTSQQFGTFSNGQSSFLIVMLHLSMLSLSVRSSTSRLQSMLKKQSVKDSLRACLLRMVWYHGLNILANIALSPGWWPQCRNDICKLVGDPSSNICGLQVAMQLWEDLGNWRSSLRKKARVYVTQCYKWDPNNRREVNIAIAKDLLGDRGAFLRDGVDEQVSYMCLFTHV